jgi:hypothetical protein
LAYINVNLNKKTIMKYKQLTKNLSKEGMPFIWQAYAFILLILVTSSLFINDPVIKYGTDLLIAGLNIIAVTSGFFISKKTFFPWGILVLP